MKTEILKRAFLELLPIETAQDYIEILLALNTMESFGHKLKRIEGDYKSARQDYSDFGMYDDCGPSYERDYYEAKALYKSFGNEYNNCEAAIQKAIANFVKNNEEYKSILYKIMKMPRKVMNAKKEKQKAYQKAFKSFRSAISNVMVGNEFSEIFHLKQIKEVAYDDRWENVFREKTKFEHYPKEHIERVEMIAMVINEKSSAETDAEIIKAYMERLECSHETAVKKMLNMKNRLEEFIKAKEALNESVNVLIEERITKIKGA